VLNASIDVDVGQDQPNWCRLSDRSILCNTHNRSQQLSKLLIIYQCKFYKFLL